MNLILYLGRSCALEKGGGMPYTPMEYQAVLLHGDTEALRSIFYSDLEMQVEYGRCQQEFELRLCSPCS